MPPLRIHFNLDGHDEWHRREWEQLLATMRAGAPADADGVLVEQPDSADCVILTKTDGHFGPNGGLFPSRPAQPPRTRPTLVWDDSDQPGGRLPGFYCSLPRNLFDARRHRSLCYPLRYNECIRPGDPAEARYLYGFMGGITSGLRRRLVGTLRRVGRPEEMVLVEQAGPWKQMFDRSGLPAKRQYAEALLSMRFVLCPRGNGVGSVRLFEAMESARVPVIISDAYVLPRGVDWEGCSVRVREGDLDQVPSLLAARNADWPRLARNARLAWEQHFRPAALLGPVTAALRELLAGDVGEHWRDRARLAAYGGLLLARRQIGMIKNRLLPT